MRLTKPLAVVAATALAATLAACGGSGGSGAGSSTGGAKYQSTANAGSTKNPEAKGPAEPVPDAVKGGTVTVMYPSPDTGPSTLDPTAGWSVTGNGIQQDLTNRSLTEYAYDAKAKHMVLVPDMATDLGQHNADFTEWKFTLKPGLKYDNGRAVKADDFAFAIERSFDADTLQGPGTQYSASYFLDGDTYKGPYADKGKAYKGVTTSGDTITIKMATPFPDMDYWGAFMAMGPIPRGAISDPPAYGRKPLSTGPYKVESFDPEKQLVLVKITNWDPASDPARHQYVDKWIMKFDTDANTTDALVTSSNADAQTTISTNLLAENYAKARQSLGARLVQGSSPCTYTWNPRYDRITDVNIRRAIGYAYPYESAISAAGYIVGVTRQLGQSILPPGIAGQKQYGPIDDKAVTTDTAKAKALLKKAGVKPNTYKITWAYKAGDPQASDAKDQISAGLKAAGFVPNPLPYSGDLYDVWTAKDDATDAAGQLEKKVNVNGVGWCADWPSALTFMPPLYQTDQLYNTGHFSEKSVDAVMKKIPTMKASEQAAAWSDFDKNLEQKYYPSINLGYSNNLFTYGTKIGGFHNNEVQGAPDYKDIFVKQ